MPTPTPILAGSLLSLWPLLLVLSSTAATAQTDAIDPVVGAAAPSPLPYTSTLSAYQAYADQPVQPWREANDRVGQIGGWRTYAKEATTSQTAPAPVATPHTGHHLHAKP